MPRHTQESAELFNDFVATLQTIAERDGYEVRTVYGQAQLLRIKGPRPAMLNVRTDARSGGWWGFTKNVEERLKGAWH